MPARTLVSALVAMPLAAVAAPSPVAVPAPLTLEKVTEVLLSLVTVLPAASRIVAVSVCAAPETFEPDSVSWICVAVPWTIV